MMELELSGKVALVAGGSRGIGLAIATRLAREGCTVAIAARQSEGLQAAQHEIGPDTSIHQADLTRTREAERLVGEIVAAHGRLDILVTCVGSGASVPPGSETTAEWQRVMALNLFSATDLITAATPLLAQSAPASIVCISSICGREALGAPVTYSAAKSALDATVKGLSRPLGRQQIRINAVSPGNIYFPGGTWDRKAREAPDAVAAMLRSDVPLGCLGKPEWVADAVAFLASARAIFITGANLVVDGGQTRGH
jgi:3-oxoacyl-[acyl-carrier protein] reductase